MRCARLPSFLSRWLICRAAEKEQVDVVTVEYNSVKEKHTATHAALSIAEDLLQTPLTCLASTSAQSSGGGGYMGQIGDARARLAQAAAEEEQTRVRLDMTIVGVSLWSPRIDGRQWKHDIKKMQAEVESWDDAMHCTQVVLTLLFTRRFLVNNYLTT